MVRYEFSRGGTTSSVEMSEIRRSDPANAEQTRRHAQTVCASGMPMAYCDLGSSSEFLFLRGDLRLALNQTRETFSEF